MRSATELTVTIENTERDCVYRMTMTMSATDRELVNSNTDSKNY